MAYRIRKVYCFLVFQDEEKAWQPRHLLTCGIRKYLDMDAGETVTGLCYCNSE